MNIDTSLIVRWLFPLFVAFICLNFLDVYSTLLAMKLPGFLELNPIASTLFSRGFQGFAVALGLKYLPLIPYFYLVFANRSDAKYTHQIKIIKFAAFVSLTAADILYLYIVIITNIGALITGT